MLEGHLIVKSQKGLNFLQIYHIPSCDSHIDLFTLGLVGKGRINLLPFSLLVYLSRHAFIITVNFYGDHHQNHTVLQFNEKQQKDLFITVHLLNFSFGFDVKLLIVGWHLVIFIVFKRMLHCDLPKGCSINGMKQLCTLWVGKSLLEIKKHLNIK